MLKPIQNIKFTDILALVVTVPCLIYWFIYKDLVALGVVVGILTAYGIYSKVNKLYNNDKKTYGKNNNN